MAIRKLLGTAACMVIIGVSAGISYGQFQRLTAQVAPTPVATAAEAETAIEPAPVATGKALFVTAGTTTWTATEKSGVTAPLVQRPDVLLLPEPPLQAFDTGGAPETPRIAPTLNGLAALTEPFVLDSAPVEVEVTGAEPVAQTFTPVVARVATAPKKATKPAELEFAATSRGIVAPGTLRRFRSFDDGDGEDVANESNKDADGTFEQVFPRGTQQAATPRRAPRAGVAASTRAVQRQARFQRVWSTGVYR